MALLIAFAITTSLLFSKNYDVRSSAKEATPAFSTSKVFVTSTSYNGNLGGLSGADAKCTARATAAGLDGQYIAWLSDQIIIAKDRIPDAQYTLKDGTVIANNKTDLTDGSIQNKINKDEFGNSVTSLYALTGTTASGYRGVHNCSSWTSSSSSDRANTGSFDYINSWWTDMGSMGYAYCNNAGRLYCFQASSPIPTPTPPAFKVFITSTSYNGNLGGLSGANSKCQSRAQAAGLTGTYKAWVSTANSEPKNWIPNAKYILINGTTIANNKTDLLDGTIQNKINKNEMGNTVSWKNTYTGTYATGDGTSYTCNNWTSSSSSSYGDIGSTENITTWWSQKPSARSQCNVVTRRLYCFQTSNY